VTQVHFAGWNWRHYASWHNVQRRTIKYSTSTWCSLPVTSLCSERVKCCLTANTCIWPMVCSGLFLLLALLCGSHLLPGVCCLACKLISALQAFLLVTHPEANERTWQYRVHVRINLRCSESKEFLNLWILSNCIKLSDVFVRGKTRLGVLDVTTLKMKCYLSYSCWWRKKAACTASYIRIQWSIDSLGPIFWSEKSRVEQESHGLHRKR
jgi:hypothetical protein